MWQKPSQRNSKSVALIPPPVLARCVPLPHPLQVVRDVPLLLSLSLSCFSTLAYGCFVLNHSVGGKRWVGCATYIVECLALSLDSMHWMTEELPPLSLPPPIPRLSTHPPVDNHRCLQTLPDVLCGANSLPVENHLFLSSPPLTHININIIIECLPCAG